VKNLSNELFGAWWTPLFFVPILRSSFLVPRSSFFVLRSSFQFLVLRPSFFVRDVREMKAVVCKQFGPPELLDYCDVPSPRAGAGEVVVSVHAASVNFPDVLVIENKYQFKPPLPFSPGSEFAGVVKEVGDGVTTLRVGDRVMAFTVYGAFAEEVVLDAHRALPMPATMEFEVAASLLLTYGTMDHALRDRAAVQASETVLVLGAAGGIGIASIEVARALGARVIAAASSDEKLAACRAHGADETINYSTTELRDGIRALTDGRGVDVVVDPVGGRYSEPALRSIAWRGRFLVVGFAAGEIPKIPLNLLLLKGCSVVGVFWGEFLRREPAAFRESVAQLAAWYAEGKLTPEISARFPLSRAADAIRMMADRKAVGKILITP
jgi:NADPH2:quinone reductase